MTKQTTFKLTLLASLCAGAMSFSALAQSDLFKELDVNADGMISTSEAQAHSTLSENFELIDLDADGNISEEEFATTGL
ncbi:hypothetical protein PN836_003670 [Ningiella sp. W23]|uniref:hypothetical protein n=1 Tax=Ningiella sp. W23 TaxID=3023715 RepID=UPI0037579CAD